MSLETAARPAQLASATFEHPLPPLPSHWHSLPRVFVHQARAHRGRQAVADSTGVRLTYRQTLLRALALGRVLERTLGPAPFVGLFLPPTVPTVVANVALALWGKIPVNLNYTASQGLVDASIDAVRDHARADVQQGARQVQDHAEGNARSSWKTCPGRFGWPTSSGRPQSHSSCRSPGSARSCPGSATTDSTPRPPSSSRRARPATRKGSSSRTATS